MSVILSIGTALPGKGIAQMQIHAFMDAVFSGDAGERKRLRLLYEKSGIGKRYSVIPDYNTTADRRILFPGSSDLEPFPTLEQRMRLFHSCAAPLAMQAIENALNGTGINAQEITHLITVSCTGMSAPGLDLELVERMKLPGNIYRTSVNFMGCYAAVHALKIADLICRNDPGAKVMIVCVELCTLHFQKTQDYDNLTANAIFGDGAAACLLGGTPPGEGRPFFRIGDFYSEVQADGKHDMAWQLSSTGFLMTLSAYIPQLVEASISGFFQRATQRSGITQQDITGWAIHPGGRKILEVIAQQLGLDRQALQHSYEVLQQYGNMSSATILFVLKEFLDNETRPGPVFGAAFGPGLTMESFLLDLIPA